MTYFMDGPLKSDVLRGDPSMKWVEILWDQLGGNEWPEGSKFRGTPPSSVYKKNDEVFLTEMNTTRFWGEPDDGIKVRRAKGKPL